jgi:hypothetical protein
MNEKERMTYLYQAVEEYRAEATRWRLLGLTAVLVCGIMGVLMATGVCR